MLQRVGIRVLAVAAIPAIIPTVLAKECETVETIKSNKTQLLKPSQFPIYDEPTQPSFEYVSEEITPLRQNISNARKVVWEYADTMQLYTDKAKSLATDVKKYADETLEFIREDSGALHRAGLITVAGFGGVVAGYKGGFMRKAFFASAGMVTAAAICYPHQAVDITQTGWIQSKSKAQEYWKEIMQTKTEKQAAESKKQKTTEEGNHKVVDASCGCESETSQKAGEDFGQSNKADKDMYSTRGS